MVSTRRLGLALAVLVGGYELINLYGQTLVVPPSTTRIGTWPRVCIVYAGTRSEDAFLHKSVDQLLSYVELTLLLVDSGVTAVLPIDVHSIILPRSRHTYDASPVVANSFRVHEWLREQPPFEHVVFQSAVGAAHYALLARGQALSLQAAHVTLIMPTLSRQTRRAAASAGGQRHGSRVAEAIEIEYLERSAVARADVLIAADEALHQMRGRGWTLPAVVGTLDEGRSSSSSSDDSVGGGGRSSSSSSSSSSGVDRSSSRLPRLWLGLPSPRESQLNVSSQRSLLPLVSVCIVHHERGSLLLQALESVRRQTLPASGVQVVVVDDGSASAAALQALDQLSHWSEFRSGRWQLLRRSSRYLGAARNEAARHTSGEYASTARHAG